MCYNSCQHFKYNPMTGDSSCLARHGCIEYEELCENCGEPLPVDREDDEFMFCDVVCRDEYEHDKEAC